MLKPRLALIDGRLSALPAPSQAEGYRKRGRALQALRGRIWLRDSGACAECGKLTIPPDFEVDHRVPLSAGGSHDESNLGVVHVDCHKIKTARELANG